MQIPFVDLKLQYKGIKREINKKLLEVAASGHFIKGENLKEFENKFAKYIGTKYSVGVGSGTDALKLSLAALDLGRGMEVILPVNTFVATAYAVLATGASPVFVDVDPSSLLINPAKIEAAITRKTKAIIPVHLFGFPAQMRMIEKIAKKHKLLVIEDSAQSHGSLFGPKKTGSFGNVSAFSFYPGKNLGAYGDGGAVTTNSKAIYERLMRLREYGGSKYEYSEIGTNSRLDEIQAAVLVTKLKYLDKWNSKRRKLAGYYIKTLSDKVPQVSIVRPIEKSVPVYHLFVIRTQKRDQLAKFLEKDGIQTGIHYPIPLHLQKSLNFLGYQKGDFPVAEKAAQEILSLPMFPELTKKQQDYVVDSISKFYAKK